ncbi:MAG: DUF721 domain-containing protein [Bacteroidales bacterium]
MKKQINKRHAKSLHFADLLMMGMSGNSPLNTLMQRAYVYALWESVVGKTTSKYTKTIYLKNKKLFIELSSSTARNEILMLRKDIVARINEKAKMELVQELFLR